MDNKAINLARAKMYHFLSAMYRDEIPLHLIDQMKNRDFSDRIDALQEVCTIQHSWKFDVKGRSLSLFS